MKNKKKTIKVKKKKVLLKKKKTVKKKTVKKKKVVRKKRKKRKKIIMEDIYTLINTVQLKKKKIMFATSLTESLTIEHTIQDAEIEYNKQKMKTQVVFTLYPKTKIDIEADEIDIELMDDEIPDIGQIFG